MGDGDEAGKLLKVGGAGFELEFGAGLPKALALLFPGRAVKRQAKLALLGKLIEKARDGGVLDDAELDYLTEALGEDEAKFIRRRQIQQRAVAAFQGQETKQLPAPDASQGSAKATPDDWVNKFWEDAGLVDDDMLQEIYARVLASEARSPGACSLRTLAVLRYLDREAAEAFAKVAPLVFESSWLPEETKLLKRFGATHAVITSVVEAGLMLPPGSNVVQSVAGSPLVSRFGGRAVKVTHDGGVVSFPLVPLTRAGRELYRVAQFDVRLDFLREAAIWLRNECRGSAVHWADTSDADWKEAVDVVNWQLIEG